MTNNKYLRLSAVNENDYYLYSCSPHEICKTIISQGKFVANLKKQTQFSKGQIRVKRVTSMVYGEFNGPGRRKNKANSKPILFSPQIYLGIEDWVEKTKPMLKWAICR